jgi:Uma2 family endonuclease
MVAATLDRPRAFDLAEIALIVEISWSSRTFDLGTKAALYARAGVADYWVLDIPARTVIIHRDPVDVIYTRVAPVAEGEVLAALAPAGLSCAVADFF